MRPLWAEGSSSQLFHRQALVLLPIRCRLPPNLLQRRGEDSTEVAPAAGDQHSHGANVLEW